MPYLNVNGTRLYYQEYNICGSSETIIFSHALLLNHSMFAAQIAVLENHYRIIAYDHRGQGKSEAAIGFSMDMDTLYEDAIELIAQLSPNMPVHFIGLSMGGFVGMRLAARKPHLLQSLVLLNTSASAEPQGSRQKYRLMTLLVKLMGAKFMVNNIMQIMFSQTFLNDKNRQNIIQQWKSHLAILPKHITRAVEGVFNRASIENEIGQIVCPVLIIGGSEDKATPPKLSQKIQKIIPHAKLFILDNVGHVSTIEAPDRVNKITMEFFIELKKIFKKV